MDLIEATQGWSLEKCTVFKEAFFEFLNNLSITSKDKGEIRLGEHVYRAQHRFLDAVFAGLMDDIHDFKVLKSRQLGITTLTRAFTIFWLGMHDGLRGMFVIHDTKSAEIARVELVQMIKSLPEWFKFPRILRENRGMIEFTNGSILYFAAAGVKAGKGGGNLGRSAGINFVHATEMGSYGDPEAMESFIASLSEEFPNRLYIWESTAKGDGIWKDMWDEAEADTHSQKTVFLGWWSKDNQIIRKTDRRWERYGPPDQSDREKEFIGEVWELYQWQITDEQLAWYRWKMDPNAETDGDAPIEFTGDVLRQREQPNTAAECFAMAGERFFDPESLTRNLKRNVSEKYQAYWYTFGPDFVFTKITPAANSRSTMLKVWEEPVEDGIYVLAADPAYGHSETSDRSAIQVLRCYADGVDQVAEYAWPLVNTDQFSWVIASLLGWYKDCYFILEINGPGEAVWLSMLRLKYHLANGYHNQELQESGLRDIFKNVKNYLYGRSDSLTPGRAYHFKSSAPIKVSILERLRDITTNGGLVIRSRETLKEMETLARKGDETIEAAGRNKDDRVIAMAMAVRDWEEKVRRGLTAAKRTREVELTKRTYTLAEQINLYNGRNMSDFFAAKAKGRRLSRHEMARKMWRGK